MATYLDAILARHRAVAAADDRPIERLAQRAMAEPPTRGFRHALLQREDALGVIAEVKRRSPSKGDLAPDLDPASLAGDYEAGGAACLSVLTDAEFFGGTSSDLVAARSATSLPTLRKDFTVCTRDVFDARIMGADAVLLIAAALEDREMGDLRVLARDLGLDVLVEIHDEVELDRALRIDADLIGVNQRDLVSFEVDTERAERVAAQLPTGVVRVAESGVRDAADATRLAAAGYHAVLVGETLVRSGDPAGAVRSLTVPR